MGLRRRIGWVMIAYGGCLVAVLGLATFLTLTRNEDDVLSQRLMLEFDHLVDQLANSPGGRSAAGELETRDYVSRAWLGDSALPESLRRARESIPKSPSELQEGEMFPGSVDSFVMRRRVRLHDSDRWLTVWLDASTIEAQDVWPVRLVRILLIGLATALVATLGLSLVLSRIVVNPLEELTSRVRNGEDESLESSLRETDFHDEIGELAGALSRSTARSASFLKREQNFARNVSHELRTPIAVIQSALELAEARGDEPTEPLRRIRRATERMSSTTEALLWLARERRSGEHPKLHPLTVPSETVASEAADSPAADSQPASSPAVAPECRLADVVNDVFDLVRHLASGRGVTLVHDLPKVYQVRAPAVVLRVAIDNLVRNALDHSDGSEVRVSLVRDRLEISRSGPSDGPSSIASELDGDHVGSRARGFGLQIVEEICERYGFALEFSKNRDSCAVLNLRARFEDSES